MEDDADAGEMEQRIQEVRETLEEEFRLKRREAQVRDRRARDLLKQEREEWEAWKRDEKARLAQQAETLRRREENAVREARRKQEARVELDSARGSVETERAAWAEERAALERQTEAMRSSLGRSRATCRRALFLGGAGGGVALLSAMLEVAVWAYVAAGILAIQALVLWRGPRTTTDGAAQVPR